MNSIRCMHETPSIILKAGSNPRKASPPSSRERDLRLRLKLRRGISTTLQASASSAITSMMSTESLGCWSGRRIWRSSSGRIISKRRTITATVRCIWMSVFPCIFLTGRSTSSPRSRSARSQWISGPVWSMTSTTRRTGQSSRRALMKRCLPVRKRSPKLTSRCRICTAASRTQKRMETPSKSKVCFFQRDRQLHGFAATGLSQSFQVSIRSSISDVNRRSR